MKIKNFEKESQWNVYADYYDVPVKVLFDKENNLVKKTIRRSTMCTYIFDEDEVPECLEFKTMKFSEFYKLALEQSFKHIGHYYAKEYIWSVDAYAAFTKDHLDKFLSRAKEEDKKQYDFLFKEKDGLI